MLLAFLLLVKTSVAEIYDAIKGAKYYQDDKNLLKLPKSININQNEGFTVKDGYIATITEKPLKTVKFYAYITAYNLVPSQTDDSPCWADDYYICGRRDIIACPRKYPKKTLFRIDGVTYECLDRTALKYDGRIDISFDKDIAGALKFGKQYKEVEFLEYSLNYVDL